MHRSNRAPRLREVAQLNEIVKFRFVAMMTSARRGSATALVFSLRGYVRRVIVETVASASTISKPAGER